MISDMSISDMSSEEERAVHRWFEEVWHEGREEAAFELFAEDGVAHGLEDAEGRPLLWPTAYVPITRAYKGAVPGLHFEIEDAIQEGDRVAVRCVVRGTHTGEGLEIAPSSRRSRCAGMTFVVVRGGQIREAWNVFDFRSLMGQLAGGPPDGMPYDRA